jgi:hypothetical protein
MRTGKQLFPTLRQIRPSIVKPDYKDFALRLGFAFNPSALPTWVFRSGIYYDQTPQAIGRMNGPPSSVVDGRRYDRRKRPAHIYLLLSFPA